MNTQTPPDTISGEDMSERDPAPGAVMEGGCLCGAVRYQVIGPPLSVSFCHCEMCRRASGAPVTAWAVVPLDAVSVTEGRPQRFASSPERLRMFCQACGGHLFFQDEREPEILEIALGTLDAPDQWPPTEHIWTDSRLRFMESLSPELPSAPDSGEPRDKSDEVADDVA